MDHDHCKSYLTLGGVSFSFGFSLGFKKIISQTLSVVPNNTNNSIVVPVVYLPNFMFGVNPSFQLFLFLFIDRIVDSTNYIVKSSNTTISQILLAPSRKILWNFMCFHERIQVKFSALSFGLAKPRSFYINFFHCLQSEFYLQDCQCKQILTIFI